MKTAALAPRAAAVLVDGLVTFFVLGYAVSLASGESFHTKGRVGFNLHGWPAFVWLILSWGYWVVFEHFWGTTPAKRLFGLRVINREDRNPTLAQSALRNALRVVDSLPYVVPYLLGFGIALRDGERRRLGDRVAGTRVVSWS